ncbi:NeuD/PglB/VioB family sugar acetyltransferase [Gammaproteobacteria bacterium]|nr:NeuD/PglB/VioB family sugar acetyltransferase [Gammaproteobacteria bacterium]
MQKNKDIILIGAGGHAISCIDVIEKEGKFKIVGIIGTKDEVGKNILGYEVIGTDKDLTKLVKGCKNACITIGQIKDATLRLTLFNNLLKIGFSLPSIKSPCSYISKHANLGMGTIVMHGVIINAGAIIGDNCIINSRALIEHGVEIGRNCHISTNSIINGNVKIKDNCFIGSCAVIRESIKIGSNVFIAMHSSIFKDISDTETVIQRH